MRAAILWSGMLSVAPLGAQSVRTIVRSATSLQPVAGAMVLALDSAGHEVARTLTNETGQVHFELTVPGRYRLRVRRIGYEQWTTAPFHVGQGDRFTNPLDVPETAIALAPLTVEGTRRCRVRPEEGSAAATLWQEAQKALEATEWTATHPTYRFRTSRYEREYDPSGQFLTAERRTEDAGMQSWPFESIAPESLAARGFVQPDSTGAVRYYGPDLRVLFSDVFLGHHCLRVRLTSEDARDSVVGLAFEPVSGRRISDITGVLRIYRPSFELRDLVFTYTNLGRWVGDGARGALQFEHLPSGAWVIRRWFIRAPVARVAAVTFDTLGVAAWREAGAQVLLILEADGKPVAAYPLDP